MNALVNSKIAGVIALLLGLAAAIWLVAAEIRNVPSLTVALAIVACAIGGVLATRIRNDILADPRQRPHQGLMLIVGIIAIPIALGTGPSPQVVVASGGVGFLTVISIFVVVKLRRLRSERR